MQELYNIACTILAELKKITSDHVGVDGNTSVTAIDKNGNTVRIAQKNDSRAEIWLHNASADVLYIGLTGDIDKNKYSLRIASYDTLILNANNYKSLYKEDIYGFWEGTAADTSKCMVTEYYTRTS